MSPDDDKASLAAAQGVLSDMSATLKAIPGCKSVQRVVCGGCLDFKVTPSHVRHTLDHRILIFTYSSRRSHLFLRL